MRRLRDVVSQPCRPGGRGLPSAATTSGRHLLAGRGWEAGGEIRRRSTETWREHLRESVPSPEARSPVLKNRRRWSAGRRFRGRCSPSHGEYVAAQLPRRASRRSVSPHSLRGREPKAHPALRRGNVVPWLFDIQIRTSMRRSRLRIGRLMHDIATPPASSLRRQGPIRRVARNTGSDCDHDLGQRAFPHQQSQGLWVPAFAGTALISDVALVLAQKDGAM